MEPVGLAMGAVALASLFSLCVQCFELIEIGKGLGAEYELLITKLSIEKKRLMIWGEAVGVLRPDQDRDQILDEPDNHQLIERILMNLHKMFQDTDDIRLNYGLEKTSEKSGVNTPTIEGSVICSSQFDKSPITQFQRRVAGFHRKAKLTAKTRWAVRDSSKFAKLVKDIKGLVDGLNDITTPLKTNRTSMLKADLVRQETQSIPDMKILEIIKESCSDDDWTSSATFASSYFKSLSPQKRKSMDIWMSSDQDNDANSWTQVENESDWREPNFQYARPPGSIQLGANGPSNPTFNTQPLESISRGPKAPRLQPLNCPHDGKLTEVLVMCSTGALVAYIPMRAQYFHPVDYIPETTTANHMTYAKLMKAISIPPGISSPCITIYCLPRMRYVHMALRFLGLESQSPPAYRCQIRFDDRLLDKYTYFDKIAERMEGYHRELSDAAYTKDPRVRRIVDAIDMNWLEQRIEYLTLPSYQPLSETLDWYTIFRQSKDDRNCVGIIVMAGDKACRAMFNAAPVLPPHNFRLEGKVYRLRELEGADNDSQYRWKAEHYCNITPDPDFDKISPIPQSDSRFPIPAPSPTINQRIRFSPSRD